MKISVRRQGLFKLQVTCEKKVTVLTPPLKQLTLAEPQLERKYVEAFAPLVTNYIHDLGASLIVRSSQMIVDVR